MCDSFLQLSSALSAGQVRKEIYETNHGTDYRKRSLGWWWILQWSWYGCHIAPFGDPLIDYNIGFLSIFFGRTLFLSRLPGCISWIRRSLRNRIKAIKEECQRHKGWIKPLGCICLHAHHLLQFACACNISGETDTNETSSSTGSRKVSRVVCCTLSAPSLGRDFRNCIAAIGVRKIQEINSIR